jgi:hypothetical protein
VSFVSLQYAAVSAECEAADSPWYPSLVLMPQLRDGEWSGLMELAGQRLRAKLAAKS